MKIKAYLIGLGIGFIVAAVIMGIALGRGRSSRLSEEEIIERARDLGMVFPSEVSGDLANASYADTYAPGETLASPGTETSQEGNEDLASSGEGDTETAPLVGGAGTFGGLPSGPTEGGAAGVLTDTGADAQEGAQDTAADAGAGEDDAADEADHADTGASGDAAGTGTTVLGGTESSAGTDAGGGTDTASTDSTLPALSLSQREQQAREGGDPTGSTAASSAGDASSGQTDSGADSASSGQDNSSSAGSSPQGSTVVTIPDGLSSESACSALESAGIVDDAIAFNNYLVRNNYDRYIQSGTKQIPKGASYEEVAKAITGR